MPIAIHKKWSAQAKKHKKWIINCNQQESLLFFALIKPEVTDTPSHGCPWWRESGMA
jgi:hypothetical protein